MRMLHIACLPFPSPQGTQALLRRMLQAFSANGHDAHLFVYPGERMDDEPFEVHRPSLRFPVPMRSGPSLGKVALDVLMATELKRLIHKLRPDSIVAHHVEAGWLCRFLGVQADIFVAHTSMEKELGFYDSPLAKIPLGAALDLGRKCAKKTVAVSPLLAEMIGATYVPLPWNGKSNGNGNGNGKSNGKMSFVYAGNLDPYQGWETILFALSRLPANAELIVGTASDHAPALALMRELALTERVHFRNIDNESARQSLYADSDVAVITRRCPGGVPIKLLDALSRSIPVVAERLALAGLPMDNVVETADDNAPESLATAMLRAYSRRDELRLLGPNYISEHHSENAFVDSWLQLV